MAAPVSFSRWILMKAVDSQSRVATEPPAPLLLSPRSRRQKSVLVPGKGNYCLLTSRVVSPDDCAPEKCWKNCVNPSTQSPAFPRKIWERTTQDAPHHFESLL